MFCNLAEVFSFHCSKIDNVGYCVTQCCVQTWWTNSSSCDRVSALGRNKPGACVGQLLLNLCTQVLFQFLDFAISFIYNMLLMFGLKG